MSSVNAAPKVAQRTISAVVTKADGTRVDLGDVSYSNANPFKTFAWYLRHPEQWAHKVGKFFRWL